MAKSTENTDLLSLQLSATLSLDESSDSERRARKNSDAVLDTSDKKLLSTPRPRRARMRTKQISDISSLLSEPATPVPASPGTPPTPGDTLFLAGRSPQGRHRLRVKQPSDLSGFFAPALPLSENTDKCDKEDQTPSFDSEAPLLIAKGHNRKGRIFCLRKNTI
mmetsp:Transcript_15862/g.26415  ORF Transcript_15862/g.26415 Transcript_15862/m.26415 type:complete len:164 (-) Transcript_15862:244-735(-)